MQGHGVVVGTLVVATALSFAIWFVPLATASPEPSEAFSYDWVDDLVAFVVTAPLVVAVLGFAPAMVLGASRDAWRATAAKVLVVAVAVAAAVGLIVGASFADPTLLEDPTSLLTNALILSLVGMMPAGLGAALGWWLGNRIGGWSARRRGS